VRKHQRASIDATLLKCMPASLQHSHIGTQLMAPSREYEYKLYQYKWQIISNNDIVQTAENY